MTVKSDPDRGIRFLVIAAALVIIIGGINQAQSVLVSFQNRNTVFESTYEWYIEIVGYI